MIEQTKFQNNIEVLSHRWSKKKSIIFYTSRHFEGNLKYAFIEICSKIKKYNFPVTVHFLTLYAEDYFALRSERLPVIYWSPSNKKPIKALLDASILVEDGFYYDFPPTPPLLFSALQGAKHVNLWHGTPIKKIHLQLTDSFVELDYHMSAIFKYCASIDTICLASKNHLNLFNRSFLFKNHKVTGYPRNDILKREAGSADYINVDLGTLKQVMSQAEGGKRIFLYAPTWRDSNASWLNKKHIEQLANVVSKLDGVLLINPHPFERHIAENVLKQTPRIFFQSEYDIYPFLKICDVLITDYSSIIFDFLLTDKIVVQYFPDHDEYIKKSRNLIPEQFYQLKLPSADNLDQLYDILLQIPKSPSDQQLKLKAIHNDFNDARSSERVGNLLLDLIGFGIFKRLIFQLKTILKKNCKLSPLISQDSSPPPLFEWDFKNSQSLKHLLLSGFSSQEEWGCWTEGSEAVIRFPKKLPVLMLIKLEAIAYGPNCNTPIQFSTSSDKANVAVVDGICVFELNNACRGEEIRIKIPEPTSPSDLNESEDRRKLGIGIRKICILDISQSEKLIPTITEDLKESA